MAHQEIVQPVARYAYEQPHPHQQQQYYVVQHHQQHPLGRPPLSQYHSYPPHHQQHSSPPHHYSPSYVPEAHQQYIEHASPRGHQGHVRTHSHGSSSSHAPGFHPYSTSPRTTSSPKKQLLFVNAGTVDPALAKPKRKRINPDQLQHLVALFDETDSPNFEQRERVARLTSMTNREVQIWFQNRRAKVIRERERAIKLGLDPSEPLPIQKRNGAKRDQASAPKLNLPTYSSTLSGKEELPSAESSLEPEAVVDVSPQVSLALPPPAPSYSTNSPQEDLRSMPPPQSITATAANGSVPRYVPAASTSLHPPSSAEPSPRATFGRSIELPSPSFPVFSPAMQAHRSPSGMLYSPSTYNPTSYFGIPSPSLSSSYGGSHLFTPNPGSAYSTSSSYFSHPEAGLYSPTTAMSSPTGNFFRLSLDSPGCYSPRPQGPNGAAPGHGMYFDRSPRHGDHPVHLAPLTSPGLWGSSPQHASTAQLKDAAPQHQQQLPHHQQQQQQLPPRTMTGHKRSHSDTALAVSAQDATPSNAADGGRVEMSIATAPPRSMSLPNSPNDVRRAIPTTAEQHRPASGPGVHALSGQLSVAQHQGGRTVFDFRRRTGPRPSSLSQISPSIKEETSSPSESVVAGGVGLGMLAMAASGETGDEDADEDPGERAARQRYLATRKLSYNAMPVEQSQQMAAGDVEMVQA
ncbi:hypothetical protein OIO90_000780 [Microbotryomycetes sp. JL221]|nr:hypothetical protein OIO90_000780 [Microbotryomycetes sp. JL221]